jgi:hypothetical protein
MAGSKASAIIRHAPELEEKMEYIEENPRNRELETPTAISGYS